MPTLEGEVYCSKFRNPDKYELIFFVEAANPTQWHGVVVLSSEEEITESTYSLDIDFELIYVRPSSRRLGLGEVMAYEVGRLIGEQRCINDQIISPKIKEGSVNITGQGVNIPGQRALERFQQGIEFHLFENEIGDDILCFDIILTDEY